MSTHNVDPREAEGQNLGYEPRDVSIGVIAKWLIGLFVFVALSAVLALGGYFILTYNRGDGNAERPQSRPGDHEVPADLPVLQASPVKDIKDFRLAEDRALTKYEWVDSKAGIAKIPVDRAMDILAARGLPDRADSSKEEKLFPNSPHASDFGDPTPRATGAVPSQKPH